MAEAPKTPPLTEAQKEAIQREKDKRLYDLETQAGAPTPERPVNTPKKYARGGVTAKYMSFTKTGKPDGMKPVTKMTRGGGIESRGKAKGRFV